MDFEDDADNAALSRPSDDINMTKCLGHDVYHSRPFLKCHDIISWLYHPLLGTVSDALYLKEEHSYTRSDTLAR